MTRHQWPAVVLIALLGCALFLGQAYGIAGRLGFPLDDAWIHARFADNLAHGFGFSYNPGIPSPGSTSPLWVLLLAVTYRAGVQPVPAALAWGIALFLLSGWLTFRLVVAVGGRPASGVIAAMLTMLMARLVWGALSGMEVSLYVCLALLGLLWHVRYGLNAGWRSYLATLAFALAAQARPECYVLFPVAWLAHLLSSRERLARLALSFVPHLALYALVLSPQWAFNLSTIGSIFPATFYAKVQGGLFEALRAGKGGELLEALTTRPLNFFYRYGVFWLENNAVLFVPALWGFAVLIRRPAGRSLVVPLTFALMPLAVGVFSGWGELVARYIANVVPLYALLAVLGIEHLAPRLGALHPRWLTARRIRRALLALAAANALAVLIYASHQYGWMVDNIEGMQVFMGRWINQNIPARALVAVNDVGAIAYFGQRDIIDTVGLTTPDVIPYLRQPGRSRDENLLSYLRLRRPDYLIIFPGWYPELASRRDLFEPIFVHTYGRRNVTLGGSTMVVYRCDWGAEP